MSGFWASCAATMHARSSDAQPSAAALSSVLATIPLQADPSASTASNQADDGSNASVSMIEHLDPHLDGSPDLIDDTPDIDTDDEAKPKRANQHSAAQKRKRAAKDQLALPQQKKPRICVPPRPPAKPECINVPSHTTLANSRSTRTIEPLHHYLTKGILAAQQADAKEFDADTESIIDLCVGNSHGKHHTQSLSVSGEMTGTKRSKVQLVVQESGAYLWHLDRIARDSQEAKLIGKIPGKDLIGYEDLSRADEAPMGVSTSEENNEGKVCRGHDLQLQSSATSSCSDIQNLERSLSIVPPKPPKFLQDQTRLINTKAHAAKLLQCEQKYAYLIRLDGQYLSMAGETLNTIRIVDQANAESQKFVMKDQSCVTCHADAFKHACRTAIGDCAKLNKKADVSIVADRPQGFVCQIKSSEEAYKIRMHVFYMCIYSLKSTHQSKYMYVCFRHTCLPTI